jgi:galactose-1-phosphate uridylyltransferase
MQQIWAGYGHHKVIIDHSNHGIALHEMSKQHLALLFSVYRDRMQSLYNKDGRIKYVLVFKNFGKVAGASIPSGFELGSGLTVNTMSPERAASKLRQVLLTDDLDSTVR